MGDDVAVGDDEEEFPGEELDEAELDEEEFEPNSAVDNIALQMHWIWSALYLSCFESHILARCCLKSFSRFSAL